MKLSMISRIIKDEVARLRRITEALIILDIMREPSSIIVLFCIQNQKTKNNTNWTHENFMPS